MFWGNIKSRESFLVTKAIKHCYARRYVIQRRAKKAVGTSNNECTDKNVCATRGVELSSKSVAQAFRPVQNACVDRNIGRKKTAAGRVKPGGRWAHCFGSITGEPQSRARLPSNSGQPR